MENSQATLPQYRRRRDFPTDDKKYCYTMSTKERMRYLVRATFLYGNSKNTYPNFQLYLDATRWSTVTITDASDVYVKEISNHIRWLDNNSFERPIPDISNLINIQILYVLFLFIISFYWSFGDQLLHVVNMQACREQQADRSNTILSG